MKFKAIVRAKKLGYNKDGKPYLTYSIMSKELKKFEGKEVSITIDEQ